MIVAHWALGPGLRLRFRGESEPILATLGSFLTISAALGDPDVDGSTIELREGQPPREVEEASDVIHRDSPLSVLQTEDFLIFRVGSVLAWFAKGSSEAGIDAGGAGTEALRAFAGYALPGLLLELAGPQGWYGIHAAALCQGQRAVLLPASSGSGKSTIFRQAANAGLGLLSDDLVWMRAGQDGEIRLHAFPRGEPCEPSPDPTIASSKLGWIVTPTIVSDAESRLVPIDFDASLAILLSQTGFLALGAPTGERFRMLVRAARSVGCYRLEAGANRAQTTSILSDLLSCTREAREPLL